MMRFPGIFGLVVVSMAACASTPVEPDGTQGTVVYELSAGQALQAMVEASFRYAETGVCYVETEPRVIDGGAALGLLGDQVHAEDLRAWLTALLTRPTSRAVVVEDVTVWDLPERSTTHVADLLYVPIPAAADPPLPGVDFVLTPSDGLWFDLSPGPELDCETCTCKSAGDYHGGGCHCAIVTFECCCPPWTEGSCVDWPRVEPAPIEQRIQDLCGPDPRFTCDAALEELLPGTGLNSACQSPP